MDPPIFRLVRPQHTVWVRQAPTDVEMDFAANAYWKYFTYDTYDPRTWVTLGDLETCLRSVPGGDVNEWVGAPDLWEAMTLILGEVLDVGPCCFGCIHVTCGTLSEDWVPGILQSHG